ncbi:cell wall-binding repeat-containing protein [Kineococcus gynurae]|uniref:Cell wall-binding repeat-containing protein n=1 Tax=Kineococcus gynurae TaxID=452979 RepID=A0ABV5LPC7_9ACTN
MRARRGPVGMLVAVGLAAALTTVPVAPAAAAGTDVVRLAGDDRYATAVAVARAGAGTAGLSDRTRPVVVGGEDFPDALSAVNLLAGGRGAVVLGREGGLPTESAELLTDLADRPAWVLGSTDVLSPALAAQVAASRPGQDVRRLGGADRYATNELTVAETYDARSAPAGTMQGRRTGILVSGTAFADALSAGPLATRERLPLVLTAPGALSPSAARSLRQAGVQQVLVVGGAQAVPDAVLEQVRSLGMTVRRVAGGDRQATAVAVADLARQDFGWVPGRVLLADGRRFADALAGAGRGGALGAPVLLTAGPGDLGTATRAWLRRDGGALTRVEVLGGPSSVSADLLEQVRVAARPAAVEAVTAADLGASWRPGCPVGPADLRRVTVPTVDLAGRARTGSIVVHADVAAATVRIFDDLYVAGFPVASMRPVEAFGGSDDASMAADNTSAFNCRQAVGSTRFSEHSYGTAIDLNPVENPYVRGATVLPAAGRAHLVRTPAPGRVVAGDATVQTFQRNGFRWGGAWTSLKDYQHFSVTGR